MSVVAIAVLHASGGTRNVEPLISALRDRGHRVVVLSDPAFEQRARALGAGFIAVDDPELPSILHRPVGLLQRVKRLRPAMRATFIDPIPAQWAAVQRLLATEPVEALIVDVMWTGAGMLAVVPATERPTVIALGMVAPIAPDREVAPYGMGLTPLPGPIGRLRNALLRGLLADPIVRPIDRALRAAVRQHTGYRFTGTIWDLAAAADVWLQATVERFEYPRTDLPRNLRWIGPLAAGESGLLPDWWDPTAEPPAVVVHTDGRVPLERVVVPTIEATEDLGVTTIVAGASRSEVMLAFGRRLPPNTHFESHVPWSRLVTGRSVFVATGDYVQVQHALRRGIPVVVTGASEPQVEAKARIRWAGVGVDVAAAEPTSLQIRAAIDRVRGDPEFLAAAARVAAQIARTHAEQTICDVVAVRIERAAALPERARA